MSSHRIFACFMLLLSLQLINNYLALHCFETKMQRRKKNDWTIISCQVVEVEVTDVLQSSVRAAHSRLFKITHCHSKRHTRLTSPKDTPHPQAIPSTMNIVRLLPAVSMQRISTWLWREYERFKRDKILILCVMRMYLHQNVSMKYPKDIKESSNKWVSGVY